MRRYVLLAAALYCVGACRQVGSTLDTDPLQDVARDESEDAVDNNDAGAVDASADNPDASEIEEDLPVCFGGRANLIVDGVRHAGGPSWCYQAEPWLRTGLPLPAPENEWYAIGTVNPCVTDTGTAVIARVKQTGESRWDERHCDSLMARDWTKPVSIHPNGDGLLVIDATYHYDYVGIRSVRALGSDGAHLWSVSSETLGNPDDLLRVPREGFSGHVLVASLSQAHQPPSKLEMIVLSAFGEIDQRHVMEPSGYPIAAVADESHWSVILQSVLSPSDETDGEVTWLVQTGDWSFGHVTSAVLGSWHKFYTVWPRPVQLLPMDSGAAGWLVIENRNGGVPTDPPIVFRVVTADGSIGPEVPVPVDFSPLTARTTPTGSLQLVGLGHSATVPTGTTLERVGYTSPVGAGSQTRYVIDRFFPDSGPWPSLMVRWFGDEVLLAGKTTCQPAGDPQDICSRDIMVARIGADWRPKWSRKYLTITAPGFWQDMFGFGFGRVGTRWVIANSIDSGHPMCFSPSIPELKTQLHVFDSVCE